VRGLFSDEEIVDAYFETLRGRAFVAGARDATVEALTPAARFLRDVAIVGSEYDPETGMRNPLFDTPEGQAILDGARARNNERFSTAARNLKQNAAALAQLAADLAPPPWAGPNGEMLYTPTRAELDAYNARIRRGGNTLATGISNAADAIAQPIANAYNACVNGSDANQCGRAVPGAAVTATGVGAVVRGVVVRTVLTPGAPDVTPDAPNVQVPNPPRATVNNPLGLGDDFLALDIRSQNAINALARPGDSVIIGNGVAPGPRLPQDAAVAGRADPDVLDLRRPVGGSITQNQAAAADIATLRNMGASNIRVNQQQLNATGTAEGDVCRAGICRPDVEATLPDGRRIRIEYDRSTSRRGPGHADRILRNDPNAIVILRTVN
jgi:hypothetical protein